MKLSLGQKVRHERAYFGKELMEIVGIKRERGPLN